MTYEEWKNEHAPKSNDELVISRHYLLKRNIEAQKKAFENGLGKASPVVSNALSKIYSVTLFGRS